MRIAKYWPIEEIFEFHYPHLFYKCFPKENFIKDVGPINGYAHIINDCMHCEINHRIIIHNLEEFFKEYEFNHKLKLFLSRLKMNAREIKEYLLQVLPETNKLFHIWDNTDISRFDLTPVGITMAKANYRKKTGKEIESIKPLISKRVDHPIVKK